MFADADINSAVEALISSKFRSGGQTCICANRLFVHEKAYDQFAERLKSRAPDVLKPGKGV